MLQPTRKTYPCSAILAFSKLRGAVFGLLIGAAGCAPAPSTPPEAPSNSTAFHRADLSPQRTAGHRGYETHYVADVAARAVPPAAPPADSASIAPDPRDWLFWRGPRFDGVSYETGLLDNFDGAGGEGSNVRWKRADLGSRSTPIVMGGKLYTLVLSEPDTPRQGEKVVCLSAETGETIWENRFNVYLSDVPDTRVGWSACAGDPETASVFAQGVCGHFQCIDARTGKTRWYIPLHERLGLLSTYGGRTNFPVLFEDLVIVSGVVTGWGEMAKPAHRVLALNKRTGDVVWYTSTHELPEDTTYSGPTIAVINGQQMLVFGAGDGSIWALQPRTGRPIWEFTLSRRGVNTPPLVVGSRVYAGHSEENTEGTTMGALVAIDPATAEQAMGANLTKSGAAWRIDGLMVGRSQPLLLNDRLWVFDDGAKLQILDAATGEPVGRRIPLGRIMQSNALYADGKVYAIETNGRWAIYRPDEQKGAEVVSNGSLPDGEECHGSPICSHGRIYFHTSGGLYCLQDSAKQAGIVAAPELPAEPPVVADAPAAYLQVIPVEVLTKPGATQQFTVRLFNERGQLLRTVTDAQFTLDGPGSISAAGRFVAADKPHSATIVRAKLGALEGAARVRVVPDLPWQFTFDDGQIPVTWVGARYRHVLLDDKLLQELQQANPVAAQLYIYFTSAFVNTQRPAQTFDNSTPQQRWTELTRFLRISATTLEEAQQQLDPALDLLLQQKVLARRQWEQVPNVGVRLTVAQAARGLEGNVVATKISTLPKGTRSRCWFGPSDLHEYTIQADVRGAMKDDKLPDIGLIAQGYTLDLQGESQRLQIRSWDAQLRMARSMDFHWEPDRWYTMKFRAAVEDGRGVLRAKVWPREQPEPAEWILEALDEVPNLAGSPGLFGNASNAEIFLDNIHVTAN